MKEITFSIVIPNWNGENLLKENLPKVIEAVGGTEIIVIDDASTDKSVTLIKKNFPQVKLFIHRKNKGFGESCNDGIERASGEIVVLLNTDVTPQKGFLKSVGEIFRDEKVFAVSLGELSSGPGFAVYKGGALDLVKTERLDRRCLAFWASGGQSAFSKQKWLELGGFDTLYKPFYFEDVDLSFRAWKRGYKIVWDPFSVVKHEHVGTIKSNFSTSSIILITERNHLFFIWKNISDKKMLASNLIWVGKRLITTLGYWKPFLAAVLKLPIIIRYRIKQQKMNYSMVSDKQIFDLFKKGEDGFINYNC